MPASTNSPHDSRDHHAPALARDLSTLYPLPLPRRRALAWLAGAGALPLIGCGGSSDDSSASTSTSTSTTGTTTSTTAGSTTTGSTSGTTTGTTTGSTSGTTSTGNCSVVPTETNGPYPADGTTALNALLLSGIVRSDIRSSFAGASGVAAGVPLTVTLSLVNANASCASLAGYAVYIWHCNQTGQYSLYSSGVTGENYLRGVQEADANGQVTFTTIFPGCYSGRWPHIHFEIYPSLALATSVSHVAKISQIALPEAACNDVYATSGYSASVANLRQITLATDNVFSDGATLETPTVSGSASAGYAIALTTAIAV